MLTIRLVRTGKKHQAYFRVVVADKRKAPGAKFIEILGNYDPHSKKLTIKKEKLEQYMKNGAQPSNTLAKVLKSEKFDLPKWVNIVEKKKPSKKKEEEKKEVKPAEVAEPVEVVKEEEKAEKKESEELIEEKNNDSKKEDSPKEDGEAESPEKSAK